VRGREGEGGRKREKGERKGERGKREGEREKGEGKGRERGKREKREERGFGIPIGIFLKQLSTIKHKENVASVNSFSLVNSILILRGSFFLQENENVRK
jgi:hypothetical protein